MFLATNKKNKIPNYVKKDENASYLFNHFNARNAFKTLGRGYCERKNTIKTKQIKTLLKREITMKVQEL